MSIRQDIVKAVVHQPGLTMRQVAQAIGRSDRAGVQGVGAQISQLCKAGKLRKDSVYALTGVPRYWPTKTSLLDMRQAVNRTPAPTKAASTSTPAKRVARVVRKPLPAPPPPKPAPMPRMIAKRPKPAPTPPPGTPETLEQFIARGGTIERLPPYACSQQLLRYDHSNTEVPIARRRPALRTRTARTY